MATLGSSKTTTDNMQNQDLIYGSREAKNFRIMKVLGVQPKEITVFDGTTPVPEKCKLNAASIPAREGASKAIITAREMALSSGNSSIYSQSSSTETSILANHAEDHRLVNDTAGGPITSSGVNPANEASGGPTTGPGALQAITHALDTMAIVPAPPVPAFQPVVAQPPPQPQMTPATNFNNGGEPPHLDLDAAPAETDGAAEADSDQKGCLSSCMHCITCGESAYCHGVSQGIGKVVSKVQNHVAFYLAKRAHERQESDARYNAAIAARDVRREAYFAGRMPHE
ncbi:hypothetical protein MMC09_000982 [Bachmanniomyces sp. S44760]|nr:hypothetical protein [Bachmanniomyces sp. S44760]